MKKKTEWMSVKDWDKSWSINREGLLEKLNELAFSYYRTHIYRIFKKNKVSGNSILELGGGTGRDTCWILKNFGFEKSTIVDFSSQALEKVKRNLRPFPACLIKQNIFDLKLKQKFDLVHSGFLVEHFYGESRKKIFQKHAEFASKNGFVFIQIPGKTVFSWIYSKTINRMNHIEEELFTKKEIINLIKEAGLKIIDFKSIFGDSIFFILAKKRQCKF